MRPRHALPLPELWVAVASQLKDSGRAWVKAKGSADVPDAVLDTAPASTWYWRVKAYTTGGGIVVSDRCALLLERKNGEVRLPKGHQEKRETVAECALREVREESGLPAPRIVERLGMVRNQFVHGRTRYIRDENWYLMTTDDPGVAEPEAQWTPVWRPLADAEALLTFESERIAMRWACDAVERGALSHSSVLDTGDERRAGQ